MNSMLKPLCILSLLLTTLVVRAEDNKLTPDEMKAGWLSLFDGDTLLGWQAHSKADWKVEGGAITVSSGEPGLLCTTSSFADYTLKLEFKADGETNSGIFLRTAPVVTKDDVPTKCYELNIAPKENAFPTGSLVGRLKTEADCQQTGWRSYEVTLQGAHIEVKYEGKKVLDYTDPSPLGRGLIGLQLNSGKIAFRNIKLKPLGMKSLFNGKDLTGWKEYPEMASKFTVANGEMNVKNGKGQLESKDSFADFVLQLECKTHAKELNSGIFFRCIPGEQMNGYECQIQNAFVDGDRNKPKDCGTGGIYRRVDARRVVANDLEWFHLALVADGPHVAAWVNGQQVTDWTDTRKPDANPRKGLRTAPGTLMIQGHDPTTDISFRNFQAMEMPARETK